MSSSFYFDDEEDLSKFDRNATKKPPAGWSASKSKSSFQDGRIGTQSWKVADKAGPMAGGGTAGPALPFRIKDARYTPKGSGCQPVYTMSIPRKRTHKSLKSSSSSQCEAQQSCE